MKQISAALIGSALILVACGTPDDVPLPGDDHAAQTIGELVRPEPIDGAVMRGDYQTVPGRLCDGFLMLDIATADGFCVGLVAGPDTADPDGDWTLLYPRNILPLPDTEDFILTDLGRWAENRGRLWHLRHEVDGTYALKRLRAGLDRPHGLALGPDGRIYIGEAHRVVRLPADDLGAEPETVIEGLPADGLHPLTSLVFLPSGDLIVGVGSKSDLCREALETGQCGEEAGLRRYRPDGAGGFLLDAALFATGLRNPMGLVYTRGGALYVSESAHDLADPDQPYDELNLITTGGADFGWPYCESAGDIAEEWAGLLEPHACADGAHFAAPVALLPPHGTPLGLVEWPAGEGLVTTLHGYAPAGHRVMAMSFRCASARGLQERRGIFAGHGDRRGLGPGQRPGRWRGSDTVFLSDHRLVCCARCAPAGEPNRYHSRGRWLLVDRRGPEQDRAAAGKGSIKTSEGAQLTLRAFQGVSNQTNQVLVLALECRSRHRGPLYRPSRLRLRLTHEPGGGFWPPPGLQVSAPSSPCDAFGS